MTDYGYIYVAMGKKYIDEAERSAASLLRINPNAKCTLITNEVLDSDVFDTIKIIDFDRKKSGSWKENLCFKILGMIATPYKKTIFVDTDTYFCGDTSPLFRKLDFYDLLICPDYFDKSEIRVDETVIEGVYPLNTGVIAFNSTDSINKFLVLWNHTYLNGLDRYWSDQPAFMEALLKSSILFFVLDSTYNFRFLNNVAFPDKEKVKIIHGRCTDHEFEIIAEKVNRDLSQRAWIAIRRKCYTWQEKNYFLKFAKILYSFVLRFARK